MRKEFRDLATPEEAREAIASLSLGGGTERVSLEDARGRVIAERIDAARDVPGFDRASMDGYAVRARDTFGADEADPVVLSLAGTVHAGEEPAVSVSAGEAVEISTGAVMPEGADAVVIVERTEPRDGAVAVHAAVAPGDSVMVAGADIAAGSRALGPGTRVTPREIGLLSALGADEVPVRRSPRVGIVSTGDELVRPGESLRPEAGQIYDVNSYAIAAAVSEVGGEPVLYPHVGDDTDEMARVLRESADECDLVLSSGSTSASTVDVIYRVVEERGELLLHGVAVKPGKPMLVGRIDACAYVGLPGYPVSALTIFRTFVAPAIRRAAGLPEPRTATAAGTMATTVRHDEGRLRYLAVGLVEDGAGDTLVYPVDKGSGATTSLVEADGVVPVSPDVAYLEAGEPVTVTLFSPDVRTPSILGVGDDDPALSRLLDRLDRPRFLPVGGREGRRRLREGVPDVAVVAGPEADGGNVAVSPARDADADESGETEAIELGGWTREWGLVVPPGNPADVGGLSDLVERDLSMRNRDRGSGPQTSLEAALSDLAAERGTRREDLASAIVGFDRAAKGLESPARAVADGTADVGLGLRATAERLGLGFVPAGTEPVRVLANPDRTEKPGVGELEAALSALPEICRSLPGFTA